MILHNFECPDGHITEKMVEPGVYKAPCSFLDCPAEAELVYLPKHRNALAFEPTVYHINAEGKIRCVMHKDAPVPKGYEVRRIESLADYRKLAAHVNKQERAREERSIENEERYFAEHRAERRSELRQAMGRMSNLGRDFARYAMEQNDRKGRRTHDAGFHIEVYE